MSDATPATPNGQNPASLAELIPPAPDAAPASTSSKRPTTRAGRKAASEARKLAAEAKPDKAPKASKSKAATPRKDSLETRLTGSLVSLGTMLAMGGGLASPLLATDGAIIVQHAESVAAALNKVAGQDPKVKAALERMLTAGVWSGLVGALVPVVLAIMANHGKLPPAVAAMLGGALPAPAEAAGPTDAAA